MALTLQDVANAKRRDDLVPGYADWIREYASGAGMPDVHAVNLAILGRWSPYGLLYIKRLAWNQVFRPRRRG
jgi:hypothetical protein